MRFRKQGLGVAAAAVCFLIAACGGGSDGPSTKVFAGPPWEGEERLTYSLEQRGVDNEAECVLTTEPGERETVLTRSCSDNRGYTDDAEVVVEPGTLKPIRSMRVYFDVEDNETTTHTIVYEQAEALFETTSGDGSRETERDLPEPTEDAPDPGWYDDDSLLWMVRGVDLVDGAESHYTHVINAGQPRVLTASIEVDGPEEVEVPAGTFSAWLVRVSSGNVVYRVWVEDAPARRVIRAQVEDSVYELTRAE